MESCPSRNEYQIGWICALKVEAAAAILMLDENFGILQEQEKTDTNVYTLGRIGRHYVVIACLPEGQYGTTSATTVANNMMRTFSDSLRIGLMVGIGGGAPSAEHDIRLGDVVVSRPEGSHGGVIQYDMGKISKDGKIQRIGSLNSPPKSLLNALSQMRAAELYDDPQYLIYLQEAIGKNARTQKNFSRPDVKSDRLFKIEHRHPENEASCAQCPAEWEIDRSSREECYPQIYYGTIASGNTLIRDGETREIIRRETGALCFEMEAAGLMVDFPCLVVRGICDYADSHKNKQWQGYAALTAAAFIKELLGYVPKGVSQESLVAEICPLLEDIKEVQRKAFDQQENHHRETMRRVLTEDQRRCHQAFKTSTYEEFKNKIPSRVEGTCEWVLNSPEYLRWWNATSHDLLWISADPGCGKSVLAKSMIDEVLPLSNSDIFILYFFFDNNDEQNNLATALCAVLHQLFSSQPRLLRHALPFWERNLEKIQYEVDDMWRVFMATVSDAAFGNTVCIFDALDECRNPDQKQLIERLCDFHYRGSPSQGNWLKFLVTSRPYGDIQDLFRRVTENFPHIHLRGEEENDQIHEEINLVTKVRVTELGKDLGLRADTQERLERELCIMKNRTYLWLYLAIDDIKTTLKNSFRPDRETVPPLPKNVPEAYERILNRIPSDQKTRVETILRIIVAARRPLTVQEMAMALGVATTPGAETAMEAGLSPNGLGKKIRQLCGLFVFIKESKIYFIHQTAREFLINKRDRCDSIHWHLEQRKTEILMTEICVKYLLMDDLVSNTAESVRSLLDYSAENWADHFRDVASPDVEVVDWVWKLYDVSMERFCLWFPKFWAVAMPTSEDPKMEALHLAAFNGHPDIMSRMDFKKTDTVDCMDRSGRTALQWASEREHLEIIQLLLEKGADVNAQSGVYGNALQGAARGGHLEVVQLLIEEGANVNAQGGEYGYALLGAVRKGHLEIVQRLVENGANVNARDKSTADKLDENQGNPSHKASAPGMTALHFSALKGAVGMTKFLCSHHANPNAQSEIGDTPLHLAIRRRIIGWGYNDHWMAGEYAVEDLSDLITDWESEEAFEILEEIDTTRVRIVDVLLSSGSIDVNIANNQGDCALHVIPFNKRYASDILLKLIEKGADLSKSNNKRQTCLHLACQAGNLDAVRILTSRGCSITLQDEHGLSPLHHAVGEDHPDVVRYLLEWHSQQSREHRQQSDFSQTKLLHHHVKSVFCSVENIDLLLQHGFEPNILDKNGDSVLSLYLRSFHFHFQADIFNCLVQKGANMAWLSEERESLIHLVMHQWNSDNALVLERLLQSLDFRAKDAKGRNVLHHGAIHGAFNEKLTSFLRETNILNLLHENDFQGKIPLDYAQKAVQRERRPDLSKRSRWKASLHNLKTLHEEQEAMVTLAIEQVTGYKFSTRFLSLFYTRLSE